MRKLTILALLAAFVAGGVFAADAPVTKISRGAVVSYAAADTAKPSPATLVVTVAGKDLSFVLTDKTLVLGKDKKAVEAATLKAGEKVAIKYTVDGTTDTAVSVTVR